MKRRSITIAIIVLAIGALPLIVGGQSRQDRARAKNLQDQGDKAVRQKNYKEAIDRYSQALAIVADNAHAHFWLGTASYYLWQEGEKALATLEAQRRSEANAIRQKNLDGQIDLQKRD